MTLDSYNSLKEKGNEAFKSKRYQDAVVHYSKAIEAKNDEPVAYSNRAMCYINLERYYEALEDCDIAIRYDPGFIKAHFRRGTALLRLSRFQQAKKEFQSVIELDKSNTSAKKELEQVDRIIESDARTDLNTYPKPARFRSDKTLRNLELRNRYAGTLSYDE